MFRPEWPESKRLSLIRRDSLCNRLRVLGFWCANIKIHGLICSKLTSHVTECPPSSKATSLSVENCFLKPPTETTYSLLFFGGRRSSDILPIPGARASRLCSSFEVTSLRPHQPLSPSSLKGLPSVTNRAYSQWLPICCEEEA